MMNKRVPRGRVRKNNKDGVDQFQTKDRAEFRIDLFIIQILVAIAIVFIGYKIAIGTGLFA